MNTADFHEIAQLRFWTEDELNHRTTSQETIVRSVRNSLSRLNPAWTFQRIEAPQLTPRSFLSDEYTDDDLWITPVEIAEEQMVLRAETTASTYAWLRNCAKRKKLRLPLCTWQSAKSFRRERMATAAKLRFFEFTQLELQCLYSIDTKADYRTAVLPDLERVISWLTNAPARVVESDRLPSYSLSTLDIEVLYRDTWREMASISIRKDYADGIRNLEVAVGLDRIVEVWNDSIT